MRRSVAATNRTTTREKSSGTNRRLRSTAQERTNERTVPALIQHRLPARPLRDRAAFRRRTDRGSDDLRADALLHAAAGSGGPAGAVRSPPPCRRRRDRLPLLPLSGGEVAERRRAAHQPVPELPRADLEQEPQARARARELLRRPSHRLEQGQQAAALRLLQPLDPR